MWSRRRSSTEAPSPTWPALLSSTWEARRAIQPTSPGSSISSPAATYYLNNYGFTNHTIHGINWQETIPMAAGAMVTLDVRDGNDHEICNTQAAQGVVTIMGVPGSMNGGQSRRSTWYPLRRSNRYRLATLVRHKPRMLPDLEGRARAARHASSAFTLQTMAHVMAGHGASVLGITSARARPRWHKLAFSVLTSPFRVLAVAHDRKARFE